jgi:hypothetical protein
MFLNPEQFKNIAYKVSKSCKLAKDSNQPTRKLEIMRNKFKFIKTFESNGIQGIVGLVEHRDTQTQLVFKLSVEIDRTIEHENQVTLELNKLRPFCPNFVGNVGCVELPISRTFIYENTPEDSDYESSETDESSEEEEDQEEYEDCKLFMDDREYLPTSVLFLEYVSPHSFYDFTKYADKSLINSLILGILCGLSIAQKHCKFTHYDLHIDNILIKECEPEAIFVYRIDGEAFAIPTFGFFPVIIDMGMSYCESLKGDTMKTSVEHYRKGLQATLFDKLNDMHHFLLSAMNKVEYDEEEFYYLSTKMLYFFKNLPVLRKKGWKMLPNDILKLSMKDIVKSCKGLSTGYKPKEKSKSKIEELRQKKIEKRNKEMGIVEEEIKSKPRGLNELPIWVDLDIDIIETLSLGISLPWKEELEIKEDFESLEEDEIIAYSFITLFVELQKLYNLEVFEDVNDLLFVVRELTTLVFENWNIISKNTSKDTMKKLFNDFKRKLIPEFRDSVYVLDWAKTLTCCKYCLNILSMLYSRNVKGNTSLIDELYKDVPIKSVNDMIRFYIRNCLLRPTYNENTILYLWDADNKTNKRVMLKDKMSLEDIQKLDGMRSLETTKKINSLF